MPDIIVKLIAIRNLCLNWKVVWLLFGRDKHDKVLLSKGIKLKAVLNEIFQLLELVWSNYDIP